MSFYNQLLAACVLAASYITLTAVWRLYLSPLSKYPGPWLAAVTYAYEFYFDAWQPGNYVWQVEKLHQVYGPIVRVNPREIHINDPSFYNEIYPATSRKRNVYDWSRRGLDAPLSLGATVDHDLHRRRREALNPFFSRAKIVQLEPMITDKINLLCNRLTRMPGVINLSDAFMALTVDIIGQFAFGKDYGFLQRPDLGGQWRRDLMAMLRNTKILTHFNFVLTVMQILPEWLLIAIAPPAVKDLLLHKKDVRQQVDEVLQDSESGDNKRDTIFHHLKHSRTLPASEKLPLRLQHEGQVLIAAGSDTTARTLTIIMYHLLSQPLWMERVRREIEAIQTSNEPLKWKELEKLPTLSAVINEGLRLNFGITGRNQRYTVDETLQLGPYTIPPHVPMSMMSLFMNANSDLFPNPWDFSPSRWLEYAPEPRFMIEKQKYLATFGSGARKCIAINLAYAELFLTIATIVGGRFSMQLFETDDSDVRYQHDFMVLQPKLDSKGVRVTIDRKDNESNREA